MTDDTTGLTATLHDLRAGLAAIRLPLELPDAAPARDAVHRYLTQIDDYLLPRLARLDAPLLAVIGGSTGAGKSTLLNSLLRRTVSRPGVIRPTTRGPVLVFHPDSAHWFTADRVLPGLARSEAPGNDPRTLQLVSDPGIPPGLAILDSPDVDSVVAENRALAAQLLSAADLWLFVTSASRYADAVPWDYLRSAAARNAVVAVVLDRVPPAAFDEVPTHLGQMLVQQGLGACPLFAVPETEVDADGLLPDAAVAPIRDWLAELARDAASRAKVVRQTLVGALTELSEGCEAVAAAVGAQEEAMGTLRTDAEQSYAEAVRTIAVQTADGTLLRGEVLSRWHDFVGTGEFFRGVEQGIGRFRDRIVAALRGQGSQAEPVSQAVESGMEVLIREEGETAARRVFQAWKAHPAGRQLTTGPHTALDRASPQFGSAVSAAVRSWQGDVLDLVRSEGASRRSRARYLALGVNGVGVALVMVVFAQTGGLVGAEIGVAGGTALLAQRLLEAVFGEDAVRRLAVRAKTDLDARVEGLLAIELTRYLTVLDQVGFASEPAVAVRASAAELQANPLQDFGAALEPHSDPEGAQP